MKYSSKRYSKLCFILDVLFVLVVVALIFGLFALADDTEGSIWVKSQIESMD